MGSLVLELQRECVDESVPLKSLARKAMLVTQKLALDKQWIESELNGYKELDTPNYRKINCQIVAKVPNQCYLPVELPLELINDFDTVPLRQSIAELEATLDYKDGFSYVTMPYGLQKSFRQLLRNEYEYFFRIPLNRIQAVLDSIRNQILDFTADLEHKGILGEGMSFTSKEKQMAQGMVINVGDNFQGILGDVSHSNVKQSFSNGCEGDFEAIRTILAENKVAASDIDALKEAFDSDGPVLGSEAFGDKVNNWIGKMIGKASQGSWGVAVGTAAGLLTETIKAYYGIPNIAP
ncbi:hypothetical protein [Shewanella colwelliana]|uniref:AbiTii domain-containing protein n=1 Tax=Shewanella colwelliana TaxID=23 RepID=UPI0022AFC40F|nr:hypothetical protein [Shewanella colwelliana]MCZ4339648.1 hypothetical protein [Shewanella colwelliana]